MAPAPLKILQTCFSHSWGGLELQALEMTLQLQSRGHQLWLACCPGSRLEQSAKSAKIRTLPFAVTGYLHPVITWSLSRFIVRQNIDIIHCQLSMDIATLVPAMKLSFRNIPIVLSKRVGSYLNKRDPLHRFTYANVSRVLAVSSVIHRNVLDTTPTPPSRVLTLFDAVDTDLFSPERIDRRLVRRNLGFGEEKILIGFVGRFSPGKGHEELLTAASVLKKKRSGFHVLIAGEASYGEQQYEQRVRALCRSLGLDDVVTFLGFRDDIPDLMAAFDILAFPSHAESFGLVLIEAMAMERPVVSTNCDGVLDIVVNEQTGLYVHPRNAAELANALVRLIDDASLRERLGKAGRKRVMELFDQRMQIDRLERIYHDVLSPAARPMHGSVVTTSASSVPSTR